MTTEAGAPVPGASLTLYSVEYDVDVAAWSREHLFYPPSRGLVTDANGELLVEGLPHGPYAWVVEGPAGETRKGSATLLPGSVTTVPVVLSGTERE